ncbi:MAG: hypothetical protein ACI8PZ_007227 [Myxococcota bacterium]|jgi:hypothetical protein
MTPGAAPLYRMVYLSRATRPMTRGEIEDLMLGAQHRNAARAITGMLLYDSGTFAQVLEGPQDVVQELFQSISADPRHSHAVVVSQWEVSERDFAGWSMRVENLGDHRDLDIEPLRELMRTQRVKDPGVAYRFLLTVRAGLAAT